MVLARPVGGPRSFAWVLGATLATFGLYGIYWRYRAHVELHRQFELQEEGRPDGVEFLLFAPFLLPLLWVYEWVLAANVALLARRMALAPLRPAGFLAGSAGGLVLALAGAFLLLSAGDARALPTPRLQALMALSLLGLGTAVAALAFRSLQACINRIWAAHAQRVRHLQEAGGPRAQASGAPA
ncbi:MAG TPA: DUF4234 domain-containing protein [Candidatus Thermoplasmatota archaeon]|nr:DUF4234 domain-containing protein [Candidatus Thermoplasmatota archaeon]